MHHQNAHHLPQIAPHLSVALTAVRTFRFIALPLHAKFVAGLHELLVWRVELTPGGEFGGEKAAQGISLCAVIANKKSDFNGIAQ